MKKFMIFLFLSIGFLVTSYASPLADDTVTTINVVKQNGTVMDAKVLVQDWEVPGKHTDLVISVDELQGTGNLYASLSAAPQDDPEPEVVEETEGFSFGDFVRIYWLELLFGLMAFFKIVVNLTPTENDNKMFGWLDSIFNAIIPNYKSGGGKHSTSG